MKIVQRDSIHAVSLTFCSNSPVRCCQAPTFINTMPLVCKKREVLFSTFFLVHNLINSFKAERLGAMLEEEGGERRGRYDKFFLLKFYFNG